MVCNTSCRLILCQQRSLKILLLKGPRLVNLRTGDKVFTVADLTAVEHCQSCACSLAFRLKQNIQLSSQAFAPNSLNLAAFSLLINFLMFLGWVNGGLLLLHIINIHKSLVWQQGTLYANYMNLKANHKQKKKEVVIQ